VVVVVVVVVVAAAAVSQEQNFSGGAYADWWKNTPSNGTIPQPNSSECLTRLNEIDKKPTRNVGRQK
jgi:hypothetical protein